MKALVWILVVLWIAVPGVRAQDFDASLPLDATSSLTREKLRSIIIPGVDFRETPLGEAVDYLRQLSVELDATDPAGGGVNIVILSKPGWAPPVSLDDGESFSFSGTAVSPQVTLSVKNLPVGDVLRFVAGLAGMEMRVEGISVVLAPPAGDVASLVPSLDAAVSRIASAKGADLFEGRATDSAPPSLLEALQSEYRVLRHREARLAGEGAPEDDPRRAALAKKMDITRRGIEEARDLLVDYRGKEKDLAGKWAARTVE